jgi:hypothetical protein
MQEDTADFLVYPPKRHGRYPYATETEYADAVQSWIVPEPHGDEFIGAREPNEFADGRSCHDWRDQLDRFIHNVHTSLEMYGDIRVSEIPDDTYVRRHLRSHFRNHGYTHVFLRWNEFWVIF